MVEYQPSKLRMWVRFSSRASGSSMSIWSGYCSMRGVKTINDSADRAALIWIKTHGGGAHMANNNDGGTKSGGIGFCGLLTIAFIILKLCNVINWSWLWVLSPIWIPILFVIIITIIACIHHHGTRWCYILKTGRWNHIDQCGAVLFNFRIRLISREPRVWLGHERIM